MYAEEVDSVFGGGAPLNKAARVCWGLALLCVLATLAAVWIRAPLNIQATRIDKTMEPTEQRTSRALCEHFDLTLDQFNQKLGRSDAVPTARWSEYPWLPCYYAAKVDGVEYRLRLGGLVEVAGADGHVREYRHWQD